LRNLCFVAVGLAAAISLAACQTTPQMESGPSVSEEMQQYVEAWTSVFNSREFENFRDLVTDDIVLLPQDAERVDGVDNYVAYHIATSPPARITVETSDVIDHGNFTTTFGSYAMVISLEDGNSVTQDGKWLASFARDAKGDWRMHRHAWNTDAP